MYSFLEGAGVLIAILGATENSVHNEFSPKVLTVAESDMFQ